MKVPLTLLKKRNIP